MIDHGKKYAAHELDYGISGEACHWGWILVVGALNPFAIELGWGVP